MKKICLLSAFALMYTSLSLAQGTYGQQPDQQNTQASSTSSGSVQGCLSGSDGNYMLTQDGTGTMYKLMGSEAQLRKHVGHEVAVMGQAGSGSAGALSDQTQNNTSAGSSDATSGNTIQVTDVKMISKHCSMTK